MQRNALILAGILLILVAGCSDTPFALEQEADDKFSELAARKAEKRQAKIKKEFGTLDKHPWAGEYGYGDGLGVNVTLVIAPKHGFDFEWRGCLGTYDRNHGSVSFAGNIVSLLCKYPNKEKSRIGVAEELIPVPWGNRNYLIPKDDVVGFCNEINSGNEPRTGFYGNYLMRSGDEEKKVVGWPDLPDQYMACLLTAPLEANLIRVGDSIVRPSICDWNFKDTVVFLDVGEKDGAQVGMELHLIEHASGVETVKITKIHDATCECLMIGFEDGWVAPQVGWKFSTNPEWNIKVTNEKDDASE